MASPLQAFAHRDFRFFQIARMVGMVASQMQGVAVGWQLYEATKQPMSLALVGLAQFIPAIGFSLVAGHVADRFDRRRVYALAHVALMTCSILLFLLARRPLASTLPVYGLLFLVGVARAFSAPASQSLLPKLVPESDLPNAIAWGSSMSQVALVAGPALGGFFYDWVRAPAPVYATCAALSATAASCVLAIRTRPGSADKRAASFKTVFAGVRYVWENKLLLGAISLDLFAVLLGGATALLPIFARDVLTVGPWGFGLLRSAPSAGAVVLAVALAMRPIRRRAGAIMLACVALFGVATIVFGASKSFGLSLAALVVVGASDMVSVFVRTTLVQLTTPDAMRGRVSAVNMVFIGASNELGEFESGLTAQWLGSVHAVVLGGIGTLVVVVAWAMMFPALRKVDALEGRAA